MATTRIKDISSTVTSLASDDYVAVDGATNGTRKMVRGSIYTDVAAAFTGAPTTYDICPLNSGTGKIDATYLPTSGDTPKGEWNASTNSPSLIDGTGTAGDYYDVTTAGSQDLGSGSITFTVGDVVKYNGSTWYKIDSVSNFLDGYSTAATSRAALEVNSVDEDAEATATKLVGPALHFDGSNDVINVAHDTKLSFFSGTDDLPFTIEGFIKMPNWVDQGIVHKLVTANGGWSLLSRSAGELQFRLYTDVSNYWVIDTDDNLTAYNGKWVHVALCYGGSGPNSASAFSAANSEVTAYVNGTAYAVSGVQTGTYAGLTTASHQLQIGFDPVAGYSEMDVSNLRIHNRKLTSAEVAQLAKGSDLGFSDQWGGATATSGTLTKGKRYRLRDWITGDDFTNVGAASNADGVEFIATGTTPTTWTNSSVVESIGTLADFRAENYDSDTAKLYDISDNAFVGTGTSVTQTGRAYPVYSTGTFSPGISFGGGSTGVTYVQQPGFYTRIGDTCFVTGMVQLSEKGSSQGALKITGLPFTSFAGGPGTDILHTHMTNAASLTSQPILLVDDGGTGATMSDISATGQTSVTDTNATNTLIIRFSGTYKIQ